MLQVNFCDLISWLKKQQIIGLDVGLKEVERGLFVTVIDGRPAGCNYSDS